MAEDKAEKKSISFPPKLAVLAQARAESLHAGNLSRYVQSLIERDLAGTSTPPAADSPDILYRIVDTLLPARGHRIRTIWEKHATATEEPFDCSQAEFLAALLDAAIEAAEAGNLQLARNQTFSVIGGRNWYSLSDAITRGDWVHAAETLRRIDPSPDNTFAAPSGPPPIETVRIQTDPGILAGRSTHGRTGRRILMEKEGKAAG